MATESMNAQTAASTLYVPVHKRRGDSSAVSSGDSVSSRSTTPALEHESGSELETLPIYSIQELLMLSKSPLATLSSEQRDHLKETVPEVALNRKQRKALEHQRHVQTHAPAAVKRSEGGKREPFSPMYSPQTATQRRNRPGRTPDRRRNAKMIVEERSWRIPRVRTVSATGALPVTTL